MTTGDYDGDGQPDLVILGTVDGRHALAVCRSNETKRDPARIKKLHRIGLPSDTCRDSVYTASSGSRVRKLYGRDVLSKADAFATSCSTTTDRRIFIYEPDQEHLGHFAY